MKFYCFPKKRNKCVLYSDYQVSKTKMFSDFILQLSPQNALHYRLRNTIIGHFITSILRIEIDIPAPGSKYVGIIKDEKIVLIEIVQNEPKFVWKKQRSKEWAKELFLGYQIISKYSIQEIRMSLDLLKKALDIHWNNLKMDPSGVHGDFTHFNILCDKNENIFFIDKKVSQNPKLFDFFYFYAYLKQCVNRCLTISKFEKDEMMRLIEGLLKEICIYKSEKEFAAEYDNIVIPMECGLIVSNRKKLLDEFYNLFY